MTLYSLALRVNELIELQEEYDQTGEHRLREQADARKQDLHVLVRSIVANYHTSVAEMHQDIY